MNESITYVKNFKTSGFQLEQNKNYVQMCVFPHNNV